MRNAHSLKKSTATGKMDFWLFATVILFSLFGLLMIFDSSNVSAFRDFADKYHYVKEQSVWFFLGIFSMLAISLVSYKVYYRLAIPILVGAILTLIAVFIPGIGIKTMGAHRWIGFGSFSFQPSELAKLALIIYLSAWFSFKERERLRAFLLLLGVIVGLVVLQPDLGTAIILCLLFVILYFVSGAPVRQFAMFLPILIAVLSLLAVISPYRVNRMMTFLNPNQDPLGKSYHLRQILISFGSGGFWGMGLGASRQKYQFLPEATTDSIFAIIGEELGFIGTTTVVIFYLFFLHRMFLIVRKTQDRFSFLLSCGILSYFGLQIFINLGAMVALLPLTGVPLPFVSYGGSHLLISMSAAGIMLNISRHNK